MWNVECGMRSEGFAFRSFLHPSRKVGFYMADLRYYTETFAYLGLEPRRTRASIDAVNAWEAKHNMTLPPAAMSDPQDAVRIQAIAALEKLGEAARPGEVTLR